MVMHMEKNSRLEDWDTTFQCKPLVLARAGILKAGAGGGSGVHVGDRGAPAAASGQLDPGDPIVAFGKTATEYFMKSGIKIQARRIEKPQMAFFW